MAKEIRWSVRADQDRIDILEYWVRRNKSNVYSIKLNNLFVEAAEQLIEQPELGVQIKGPATRRITVKDYYIYYRIHSDSIEVITVWDSRRNPKKFKL